MERVAWTTEYAHILFNLINGFIIYYLNVYYAMR
jgi:hypothetical protein